MCGKNEIEKEVKERKITQLVHFTKLSNLQSILQKGLIPRCELEKMKISFGYSDEHRYDGHKEAVSFSIEFPNFRMFYSKRQQNNDVWVVLSVKPDLLWEKDCLFCSGNAAAREVQCIEGLEGLKGMYDGERSSINNEAYPTNEQAEVLVPGNVEVKYITYIYCKTEEKDRVLKEISSPFVVCDDRMFFSRRC